MTQFMGGRKPQPVLLGWLLESPLIKPNSSQIGIKKSILLELLDRGKIKLQT